MESLLKKAGQKSAFNKEKIKHLSLCIKDPLYFAENFFTIQTFRGADKFRPYEFQKEIIKTFHDYKNVVALTARQMGKTTCAACYILWKSIFQDNQTILILAQLERQALEIMHRVRYAYEELPEWIKPGVITYNKGSIEFDNGSRILSRATSPNAARGLSLSLLYLDEFAFVPPKIAEEFWSAVQPTLSTGGQCIITSTPNSDEDLFAKIYFAATKTCDENGMERPGGIGENGYKAITFKWNAHPERDEKWAADQISILGKEMFERECNCSFIQSDETLIDQIVLYNLKGKNPIKTEMNGKLRWYEPLSSSSVYLIGLDPATGTGGDYSAIQVFRLDDMCQVAEWSDNKSDVKNQLSVIKYICSCLKQLKNNEVYWSFENNGIGEAIVSLLKEIGEEKIDGILINEPKVPGQVKRKRRKGLITTTKNKMAACARFKRLVETNEISLNSRLLISELKNYVRTGSNFSAKRGCEDDLVSAILVVIRLYMIIGRYYGPEKNFKGREEDFDDLEEENSKEPMPVIVL